MEVVLIQSLIRVTPSHTDPLLSIQFECYRVISIGTIKLRLTFTLLPEVCCMVLDGSEFLDAWNLVSYSRNL